MSDYTPSMTNAQGDYVLGHVTSRRRVTGEQAIDVTPHSAEFDRFIAKVKADALREAESLLVGGYGSASLDQERRQIKRWLRERADRIEGEA